MEITSEADMDKSERLLNEIHKRRHDSEIIDVAEEKAELVIFTLGKEYYAFYGHDIREIIPHEEISFVPGCPEHIIGIINVRGDIEAVVNLHKFLGLPNLETSKTSRIIIASKNQIRTGILVDSVEDVIEFPVKNIKPPIPTIDRSIREFAVGGETIYQQKYVTILDTGKIFGKLIPE